MKRSPVLKRQAIRRNKPKKGPNTSKLVQFVRSFSFKLAILLMALVTVSLMLLFLYNFLLTSPYIKLENVIITGVDEKVKDELLEMSHLNAEMSLLGIHLNDLKQRLERHPWIRAVELEKRFPHTILIRAEQEVPVAIVALDTLTYMNRWGSVIKEVQLEDKTDYPIITGISEDKNEMAKQLQLAACVLGTLESETGPWSSTNLAEIHVSQNGNVCLYSVSLPLVIKMRGIDVEAKKDHLRRIITHLKKTGLIHTVKVIDLNYQNSIVVSFDKG
jgi:cell division protein FtsQ